MAAGHADFLPGYIQPRFLKNTTAIFQMALGDCLQLAVPLLAGQSRGLPEQPAAPVRAHRSGHLGRNPRPAGIGHRRHGHHGPPERSGVVRGCAQLPARTAHPRTSTSHPWTWLGKEADALSRRAGQGGLPDRDRNKTARRQQTVSFAAIRWRFHGSPLSAEGIRRVEISDSKATTHKPPNHPVAGRIRREVGHADCFGFFTVNTSEYWPPSHHANKAPCASTRSGWACQTDLPGGQPPFPCPHDEISGR